MQALVTGPVGEIVFAPDSGAGFLVGFGGLVALLGLAAVVLFGRKQLAGEHIGVGAWAGAIMFLGMGAFLAVFACLEARAVSVSGTRAVLHYRWPRGDRVLDAGEIRATRIELRGTEHPSPRLVIELRDGETLEGEGTSAGSQVEAAKAALDEARAASGGQ